MELKTTAGLITKLGKVTMFVVSVNEKNCFKIKKKLEAERNKVLEILKDLKNSGKIKSVSIPRNKRLQGKIDITVMFKEDLTSSIEKIREIYFK